MSVGSSRFESKLLAEISDHHKGLKKDSSTGNLACALFVALALAPA